MTTFCVDIDQTIATGSMGQDLAECVQHYRTLGVAVPEQVQSWCELVRLPAVLRRREPLPGALEGVRRLAAVGDVVYVTTRAPEAELITRGWLYRQGFPAPGRVLMCQSMAHKLQTVAQYEGPLVLIDDGWRLALECWADLEEGMPALAADLQRRLTVVAFGVSQVEMFDGPERLAVPVVTLPEWRDVDAILLAHQGSIKKEPKDSSKSRCVGLAD